MQTIKLDPAKLLGFRLAGDDLVAGDKATGVVLGAKLGNKGGKKGPAKLGAKFAEKVGGKTDIGSCGVDELSFEARPLDPAPDQA